MSGFGINKTIQTGYNGSIEENKQITNTSETSAEKPLPIVAEDKPSEKASDKKNNVLTTKLTPENFEQTVVQEYSEIKGKILTLKDVPDAFLIEKFHLLLANMSDDDKCAKSQEILTMFQSRLTLVKEFFNSFKDPKKAQECADNISLYINKLENIDSGVLSEIIKNMSVPGTNKLFKQCKEGTYEFYQKHQELIDKVYKNNLSEKERQVLIDSLSNEDKQILEQYCQLTNILLNITQYSLENGNLSQEEKEDLVKDSFNFFKLLPSGCDRFLESFAHIYSDNSNNLNFDKTKLAKLINELSDNKFSETIQKMSEKSAVDSETGMLKNKSEEVVTTSEQKIEAIKQEIALNTQRETSLPQDAHTPEPANNEAPLIQAFSGKYSFENIKDIIIGKTKTQCKSEEKAAIEGYKLLNTAMQGNLLQRSTGDFFNKLIDNTKTSTLKELLAVGWKGRSFDITKKVEETIEERKDDVA